MQREFTKGANRYALKTSMDTNFPDEISLHFENKEEVKEFFSVPGKSNTFDLDLKRIAKDSASSYCCRSNRNRSKLSDQRLIEQLINRIYSGELKIVQKSVYLKRRIDPIGWFDWDKFFADPRVQKDFHALPEKVQLATMRAWQNERDAPKITEIFRPTDFSRTPPSHGTIGVGGTFTAGTGKAGSVTFLIVTDTSGNVGYLKSAGAGGMGGSSVSGGFLVQVTDAKNIYKLKGLSTQTGGSFGEGYNIGFEYIIGNGYKGVNFSFGVGGGLTMAELHSIAEYASVNGAGTDEIINYVKELKKID